jgi:chaperonin GroEL
MAYNFDNLEKEIRMGMNLIDRDEYTASIKAISHIAAQTVCKTLGPYAHTTIIDDGNFTYPTKDGWSILQRIRFQDPTHNSIFNMLKNISFRIVDKVGDGTTTAMVTADHFLDCMDEALKKDQVWSSYRQADIVSALNDVRDMVIKDLEEHAVQIAPDPSEESPDYQSIHDVAYISSNGNEKLASIMQTIYQKTGNPNVIVDMDGGKEISYEIQTGYRLDCSFLMSERYSNTSEHYYNTNGREHMLVIFDHNVTYQRHAEMINFLLGIAQRTQRPIILMAPYFDDVISSQFSIMVQQSLKENPNSIPGLMIVQIPDVTRKAQKDAFMDFAALASVSPVTATTVKIFTEMRHNDTAKEETDKIHDKIMEMPEYSQFTTAQQLLDSCYGTVKDATIGKNFFTLTNINYDSVLYKERLALVQKEYDDAKKAAAESPTNLNKAFLEASQRLNKLSGALGVIHVGGVTDLERQCNRDIVDDTFLACRSAYENGVVAGLNLGVLASMHRVDQQKLSTLQNFALKVLHDSYERTAMDILSNKYHDVDAKCWDFFGNHLTASELIDTMEDAIVRGELTCYDIEAEAAYDSAIPSVCNSVSTDIEILYGITSILGMVLTSDQYMSVNRMYDKQAAIRQQEALNERTMTANVETVMKAIDGYFYTHPTSMIGAIAKRLENTVETPVYQTPTTVMGGTNNGQDVMMEYDRRKYD